MIKIEVRSINLSKSKILQMDYIGVPKALNYTVLGWVNMDKKRYVIVKLSDYYYRAEYITELNSEVKEAQFRSDGGGWEFPPVTHIRCSTFNKGNFNYSPDKDESHNVKLYEHLVKYKREVERSGQIYY
jgi:hypothetical protein